MQLHDFLQREPLCNHHSENIAHSPEANLSLLGPNFSLKMITFLTLMVIVSCFFLPSVVCLHLFKSVVNLWFHAAVVFHCMNIPQFFKKIHLTINGHLGCLQVLAITNSAAVNIPCQNPPVHAHSLLLEMLGDRESLTSTSAEIRLNSSKVVVPFYSAVSHLQQHVEVTKIETL